MFLIKGNSGCDIALMETERDSFVRKSCNKEYSSRLESQSLKQEKFYDLSNKQKGLRKIVTPKILKRNFKDAMFFDMEFFQGLDLITFFENCGKKDLDNLSEKIFDLIDFELSLSNESEVSSSLLNKSRSTIKKVRVNVFSKLTNKEIDDCEKILEESFSKKVILPVGLCHGDLTFSNMLIDTNADIICLIDFLDSFVESPFFDVVKLRQDTSFLWTVGMHERVKNLTKIQMCFEYMDRKIHTKFKGWEVYTLHYKTIQILNMLRVDQYTNNEQTAMLIRKAIRNLLYENDYTNNTSSRQIF